MADWACSTSMTVFEQASSMAIIIIPARYGSSRFPGKPLVPLRDSAGTEKPLIQRTYEAAKKVKGIEAIYIATDDERIAAAARRFGAPIILTSQQPRNGTERCAEALRQLETKTDLVINVQGDAPLTPPSFVESLITAMAARDDADMATPVLQCNQDMARRLVADRQAGLVGATTAVFGSDQIALYFSKEVLPHHTRPIERDVDVKVFHHVGVYAYRPDALLSYPELPQGRLEAAEGLEQLRFLESGRKVLCVEVSAPDHAFWELNNPIDVSRIEAAL